MLKRNMGSYDFNQFCVRHFHRQNAAAFKAVMKGAGSAVELVIGTLGMMCAWTGFMKIADAGGLTAVLCKVFNPLLKRLFPRLPGRQQCVKSNFHEYGSQFLGLGNAATPLGIAAMKEMQKENPNPSVANNSMVMFVVINTASIQLIPTFMGFASAIRRAVSV